MLYFCSFLASAKHLLEAHFLQSVPESVFIEAVLQLFKAKCAESYRILRFRGVAVSTYSGNSQVGYIPSIIPGEIENKHQ
jgi:hypothetical protein